MPQLILYSKPGCHLCEGLQEKLSQLSHLPFELEVRNINQNPEWLQKYQYEIPVLCRVILAQNPNSGTMEPDAIEQSSPRQSPRAPLSRLEQMIQTYLGPFKAE